MLTFTSAGTLGLRLQGGDRPLVAFDPSLVRPGDLLLLSVPKEEPKDSVLSWPGEYDFSGITIRGIGQNEGQHVSFLVVVDSIRCGFFASPLQEWPESHIALLGQIDVLVLPSDESKHMQTIIDDIDPRVLILLPGSTGQVSADVLKACGAAGKEFVREYKLKSLPAEGREVVVLA